MRASARPVAIAESRTQSGRSAQLPTDAPLSPLQRRRNVRISAAKAPPALDWHEGSMGPNVVLRASSAFWHAVASCSTRRAILVRTPPIAFLHVRARRAFWDGAALGVPWSSVPLAPSVLRIAGASTMEPSGDAGG